MNTPARKKALLIGIQLPKVTDLELTESLHELSRLVTTLGYEVIGQVTQKRPTEKSAAFLGEGKLKEMAQWTGGSGVVASLVQQKVTKAAAKKIEQQHDEDDEEEDNEEADDDQEDDEENFTDFTEFSDVKIKQAQLIVADHELSPSQTRNLESASGVTVLDRTGVIIEIFSKHARTRAARLQVEIAKLNYVAPRLRETGGGEDRQGGGVGGKGAGETSLELDKRRIRDRIKELKMELASIGKEQDLRRARRSETISVALVGYTNAGKSSLMRALTGSEVLVEDKLFATLDTTVRPLYPESMPKILLSDTVGFIKKLPHDLVASFKSTLDEALDASLLLYVVDASDPSFKQQLAVTQEVLSEVGVKDTPYFLVLNKKDNLSPDQQKNLLMEYPEAIQISTRDPLDVKMMRLKIIESFEQEMIQEVVFVPYTAVGIIGDLRSKMRVLSESYNEQGVSLTVKSTTILLAQLKHKLGNL